MKSLARAITSNQAVGDELPMPFQSLNDIATLRTQELVVVAGGPGGGKSTLAVNIAHAVDFPVLYIAQDSAASVISRLVALEVGHKTERVYRGLQDPEERDQILRSLKRVRNTLVLETGTVTVERVRMLLEGLEEWIGYPPPLVIIDNLIDMTVPGKNFSDQGFYSESLPQLKVIAHELNTCVMVLHHVTRSAGRDGGKQGLGNKPMKMADLLYAGERTARHVWGCYVSGERQIRVQVLKQQDGAADPDGNLGVYLRWVPEYTKLADNG